MSEFHVAIPSVDESILPVENNEATALVFQKRF